MLPIRTTVSAQSCEFVLQKSLYVADIILWWCDCSGRSCSPSRENWRCCQSSTPRNVWRTLTWPRHWRLRGRPSGSVRERTRSSTHTTRCATHHTPVYKYLLRNTLRPASLHNCSELLVCDFCRSWTTVWRQRSLRCAPWRLRMAWEKQTPQYRGKSSMS